MTQPAADGTRFVESADGTWIAVQVSGRGRPLVLVHGTSADHNTWGLVRPLLDEYVTTYAVERRGRGASGDAADSSLAVERADVAAVVRSAAQTHGQPVDLLGHSYGGNVAYEVALDCPDLRRLVLYEGWPTPDPAHVTFDAAEAARIDVPVLLLVGEESPAEIRADPEVVADAMQDARVEVLAGQGHLAHLAAPEAFVAAVLPFLAEG